jgi:hypothetical protein
VILVFFRDLNGFIEVPKIFLEVEIEFLWSKTQPSTFQSLEMAEK